MKNTLEGINHRLDKAESLIINLVDKKMLITQIEHFSHFIKEKFKRIKSGPG